MRTFTFTTGAPGAHERFPFAFSLLPHVMPAPDTGAPVCRRFSVQHSKVLLAFKIHLGRLRAAARVRRVGVVCGLAFEALPRCPRDLTWLGAHHRGLEHLPPQA